MKSYSKLCYTINIIKCIIRISFHNKIKKAFLHEFLMILKMHDIIRELPQFSDDIVLKSCFRSTALYEDSRNFQAVLHQRRVLEVSCIRELPAFLFPTFRIFRNYPMDPVALQSNVTRRQDIPIKDWSMNGVCDKC